MSIHKKKPDRPPVVHGITDQGLHLRPGVVVPPPPPARPANPHLFFQGQKPVWGWRCTVTGCPYGRSSRKWDENTARRALEDHKRMVHP